VDSSGLKDGNFTQRLRVRGRVLGERAASPSQKLGAVSSPSRIWVEPNRKCLLDTLELRKCV